MTVVGRSSSAVMLVPVTVYIFAATLPIPCVVSVLPVPGRAGWKAALVDRRCWFSATGANFWKSIRSWLQQAPGSRLTCRSRRQKAAGRHAWYLQLALRMDPIRAAGEAIIHRAFHYVNSHPREGTPSIHC